jgi:hypothetical protein
LIEQYKSLRSLLIEQSFPSTDELLDYCVTQCNGCVMKNATYSASNAEVAL